MQTSDDFFHTLSLALEVPAQPVSSVEEPITTDLRQAAVATILRPQCSGPELLFIERAEHPGDPWSGHMAFPGGRRDPVDVDEQGTAERETWEEIGLVLPEEARFLGQLDNLQARARRKIRPMLISVFVYWMDSGSQFSPKLSEEVQQILWIPLLDLLAPQNRCRVDYTGIPGGLPGIRVQERIVWGLTLRMLENFVQRVLQSPLARWLEDSTGHEGKHLLESFR